MQFLNESITNYLFEREYETTFRLWSFDPPDWHMNWKDIEDISAALRYINSLLKKYENDSPKRAALLYEKFMILAGYNLNGFGLRNGQTEYIDVGNDTTLHKIPMLNACEALSDSLGQIEGGQRYYYVKSQFLLGILISDVDKGKGTVQVNVRSAKYFRNVLAATANTIADPFQIFSATWLKRYQGENIRIPHYPSIDEYVAVDTPQL